VKNWITIFPKVSSLLRLVLLLAVIALLVCPMQGNA